MHISSLRGFDALSAVREASYSVLGPERKEEELSLQWPGMAAWRI